MTLMDITPPNLVGLQEQFYNRGVLDERERIIKLIEEAKVVNTDHKFFLIRAIKGEQK